MLEDQHLLVNLDFYQVRGYIGRLEGFARKPHTCCFLPMSVFVHVAKESFLLSVKREDGGSTNKTILQGSLLTMLHCKKKKKKTR